MDVENSSSGKDYAERPKEGELWQEMIRRQQRKGNSENGYSRELLRSLPEQQQQDKEKGLSGEGSPFDPPLTAGMPWFEAQLYAASQRGGQQQEQELER